MSTQIDDGGEAFPSIINIESQPVSDLNRQGRLVHLVASRGGMSLRDYFAANAISQCIWLRMTDNGHIDFMAAARAAYEIADAMLAERNKPKQDL